MPLAIVIVGIIALAAIAMFVIAPRVTGSSGRLSRETRARDQSVTPTAGPGVEVEIAESAAARERAGEARAQAGGSAPVVRDTGDVVEWQPVDPEEIAVSRRMFLNRAILSVGGLAVLPAFGLSLLAFLWPSGVGGFGGKVAAKLSEAQKYWQDKKQPFYVPQARTYLQPYPTDGATLAAAKKIYDDSIYQGMSKGVVALYQKCVHLGCRVPWCDSAQWFECPCHGSKYNRVGEKQGGPAPRGLDRFEVTVDGDNLTINTSTVIQGPSIGTDTTKQAAEGPHCV